MLKRIMKVVIPAQAGMTKRGVVQNPYSFFSPALSFLSLAF